MDDKDEAMQSFRTEQKEEINPPSEETLPQRAEAVTENGLDPTALEDELAEHLTPEHRKFLLCRHKTLDLDLLPTMDPADPLNWPPWKVLLFRQRSKNWLTLIEKY